MRSLLCFFMQWLEARSRRRAGRWAGQEGRNRGTRDHRVRVFASVFECRSSVRHSRSTQCFRYVLLMTCRAPANDSDTATKNRGGARDRCATYALQAIGSRVRSLGFAPSAAVTRQRPAGHKKPAVRTASLAGTLWSWPLSLSSRARSSSKPGRWHSFIRST